MPYTSKTKYLKKKELLSNERFYRLLSAQTNFIDPETTKLFFVGLVFLISEELTKHKFIRLPMLGDMALVEQKPRVAWCGRLQAVIGSREVLKFYPKEHLRRYFNKRQGLPRYSEVLPPKFIE